MKKTIALLFGVLLLIISCERDDICTPDTPTTPRLIIDFLDFSNIDSATSKNVPSLAVKGIGNDAFLDDFKAVTSGQVILPLKTNEDSTQFRLYKSAEIDADGTTITAGNEDIITISYTREEVFVSRACGFKTVFKNVVIQLENDTDNWIQVIFPINDNQSIEDETTTHFNIFH